MSEPITARQFWIRSPGIGEIREGALSGAGPDSVMVETHFSGISRGTEALIFRGEVPPSEYQRMRAPFQEGDFPGPVKYGYSSVGVVVDGPAELRDQMVFCLHPHQDRYLVPASAVTPLPPEVPASRAVLAANMETAVNILWDATPRVGDRIVVVGAGVGGLLSAWLAARLPAADVTVLDVDPGRRATAESLGLDFSTELPVGTDADLVIHASGQPAGLAAALEAAGVEGTVIEASAASGEFLVEFEDEDELRAALGRHAGGGGGLTRADYTEAIAHRLLSHGRVPSRASTCTWSSTKKKLRKPSNPFHIGRSGPCFS